MSVLREQDEHITEPQFVNLSYLQARHDYLLGNYPVVRDDAAQMCALQMFAAHGATLTEGAEDFIREVEKHIAKQVLDVLCNNQFLYISIFTEACCYRLRILYCEMVCELLELFCCGVSITQIHCRCLQLVPEKNGDKMCTTGIQHYLH